MRRCYPSKPGGFFRFHWGESQHAPESWDRCGVWAIEPRRPVRREDPEDFITGEYWFTEIGGEKFEIQPCRCAPANTTDVAHVLQHVSGLWIISSFELPRFEDVRRDAPEYLGVSAVLHAGPHRYYLARDLAHRLGERPRCQFCGHRVEGSLEGNTLRDNPRYPVAARFTWRRLYCNEECEKKFHALLVAEQAKRRTEWDDLKRARSELRSTRKWLRHRKHPAASPSQSEESAPLATSRT